MTRWATVGVAAAIGLLGVGVAGRASADGGWHRVRIDGAIESDNPTVGPFACDAANHCVVNLSAVNAWSGGLAGSSASRSALVLDQSTGLASIEDFELFTGHVAGCGDGSFTLAGAITRLLQSPGAGTLAIVADSGSGALAGISGKGTFSVTPTGPTSASSTFTLTVRCRRPTS